MVSPKEILRQQRGGINNPSLALQQRAREALNLLYEAARFAYRATEFQHPLNGDKGLYPNKIASFSKTLLHNSLGEVDLNAFASLVRAIQTQRSSAFENIPLGGTVNE